MHLYGGWYIGMWQMVLKGDQSLMNSLRLRALATGDLGQGEGAGVDGSCPDMGEYMTGARLTQLVPFLLPRVGNMRGGIVNGTVAAWEKLVL
jgi:hypothetical protein